MQKPLERGLHHQVAENHPAFAFCSLRSVIGPRFQVIAQLLDKRFNTFRIDGFENKRIDAEFAGVCLDVRVRLP